MRILEAFVSTQLEFGREIGPQGSRFSSCSERPQQLTFSRRRTKGSLWQLAGQVVNKNTEKEGGRLSGSITDNAPPIRVSIVALGCAKNTVDAEVFLGDLQHHGYQIVSEDEPADAIIVNTCTFIDEAKSESIAAILQAAAKKRSGTRAVVVTGCMAQRYAAELAAEIPEVDAVVGFAAYPQLAEQVDQLVSAQRQKDQTPSVQVGSPDVPFRAEYRRHRLGVRHTAYLRVAEGCDHQCAFCAIPQWRGRFRSKPYEQLIQEAHRLVEEEGVRELCLIAEDTNMYGMDAGRGAHLLADVLRYLQRALVPRGLVWIRLLYCYPSYFSEDLLDAIAECPAVVKCIDIPLQHASDAVLLRMRRPLMPHTRALLTRMRQRIPGLQLRSTFITGTPGETAQDHQTLVRFLQEMRFARAGFFTYSAEENTPMAQMDTAVVPARVQEKRRDHLLSLQQSIQEELAESLIGQELDILIDRRDGGHLVGRTFMDAPDIDGLAYLLQDDWSPGELVRARVIATSGWDLLCDASPQQ
jgi:ribosomal protein S12 methylthiotransferase